MKIIIKDVQYNRGYVIGPYLQERPGVNADIVLEEGEDQEECALKAMHYLKSITDKFHKEANPLMYLDLGSHKLTENGLTIDYKKWEQFEIDIDNADTPEELEAIIKKYEAFPGKYLSTINAKRQSFKK